MTSARNLSRRTVLFGAMAGSAALVTGCSTSGQQTAANAYTNDRYALPRRIFGGEPQPYYDNTPQTFNYAEIYAARMDNGFQVSAVPFERMEQRFLRHNVENTTGHGPGELVVDIDNHFVYFTQPNGRAMRYGVGLGREGFAWSGTGMIERKAVWPRWHPPAEMIDRQPELERYRTTYDRATDTYLGGMDGGPMNPLGARALYIYQDGKDTLYRLHGNPEWWSIGKNVSSGCVRLINQDVIDLYERVPTGTPLTVRYGMAPPAVA